MLQMIDVLIGFALVMLILSALVTALVQWVVTTLLNLKGWLLRNGVAQLIHMLDRTKLSIADARAIADYLLTSDAVGKTPMILSGKALADVVHREELTKMILAFAGGVELKPVTPPSKEEAIRNEKSDSEKKIDVLRTKLLGALQANGIADGITDPATASKTITDILDKVRARVVELEKDHPDLASDVRQSMALAEQNIDRFLGRINGWFDQTIDRTVDTFTTRARLVTVIAAALVACFFQVDSFQLLGRLSTDRHLTQTLVDTAIKDPNHFKTLAEPTPTPTATSTATGGAKTAATPPATAPSAPLPQPGAAPTTATAPTPPADKTAQPKPSDETGKTTPPSAKPELSPAEALRRIENDPDLTKLVDTDLIAWPTSWDEWVKGWSAMPRAARKPDAGQSADGVDGNTVDPALGNTVDPALGNSVAGDGNVTDAASDEQDGESNVYGVLSHLLGVLLTMSLLTLGAPTWYAILKDLIGLRSIAARKDDEQRAIRQTNQT